MALYENLWAGQVKRTKNVVGEKARLTSFEETAGVQPVPIATWVHLSSQVSIAVNEQGRFSGEMIGNEHVSFLQTGENIVN